MAGGNITVVTESQANNSTNAASTAYVDTAVANQSGIIYRIPAFTNSADTNENTAFTTNITGGLMSSNGAIRFKIPFKNDTDADITFTFRLKYGATTIATTSIRTVSKGGGTQNGMSGIIEGVIYNNNSTSSQLGTLAITSSMSFNGSGSNAVWGYVPGGVGNGSASEDSTATKALTLTVQASTSGGTQQVNYTGLVEILN